MPVYVKCGVMWNVAISDMVRPIEMQNVSLMCQNMEWCGMWCPGMYNVAIMQDVESYDAM